MPAYLVKPNMHAEKKPSCSTRGVATGEHWGNIGGTLGNIGGTLGNIGGTLGEQCSPKNCGRVHLLLSIERELSGGLDLETVIVRFSGVDQGRSLRLK